MSNPLWNLITKGTTRAAEKGATRTVERGVIRGAERSLSRRALSSTLKYTKKTFKLIGKGVGKLVKGVGLAAVAALSLLKNGKDQQDQDQQVQQSQNSGVLTPSSSPSVSTPGRFADDNEDKVGESQLGLEKGKAKLGADKANKVAQVSKSTQSTISKAQSTISHALSDLQSQGIVKSKINDTLTKVVIKQDTPVKLPSDVEQEVKTTGGLGVKSLQALFGKVEGVKDAVISVGQMLYSAQDITIKQNKEKIDHLIELQKSLISTGEILGSDANINAENSRLDITKDQIEADAARKEKSAADKAYEEATNANAEAKVAREKVEQIFDRKRLVEAQETAKKSKGLGKFGKLLAGAAGVAALVGGLKSLLDGKDDEDLDDGSDDIEESPELTNDKDLMGKSLTGSEDVQGRFAANAIDNAMDTPKRVRGTEATGTPKNQELIGERRKIEERTQKGSKKVRESARRELEEFDKNNKGVKELQEADDLSTANKRKKLQQKVEKAKGNRKNLQQARKELKDFDKANPNAKKLQKKLVSQGKMTKFGSATSKTEKLTGELAGEALEQGLKASKFMKFGKAAKVVFKKIPLIGTVFDAMAVKNRLNEGDSTGAAMNAASSLLYMGGPVGIMAGIMLDALEMERQQKRQHMLKMYEDLMAKQMVDPNSSFNKINKKLGTNSPFLWIDEVFGGSKNVPYLNEEDRYNRARAMAQLMSAYGEAPGVGLNDNTFFMNYGSENTSKVATRFNTLAHILRQLGIEIGVSPKVHRYDRDQRGGYKHFDLNCDPYEAFTFTKRRDDSNNGKQYSRLWTEKSGKYNGIRLKDEKDRKEDDLRSEACRNLGIEDKGSGFLGLFGGNSRADEEAIRAEIEAIKAERAELMQDAWDNAKAGKSPKRYSKGGLVPGNPNDGDSVPALLQPGEFVLPTQLVDQIIEIIREKENEDRGGTRPITLSSPKITTHSRTIKPSLKPPVVQNTNLNPKEFENSVENKNFDIATAVGVANELPNYDLASGEDSNKTKDPLEASVRGICARYIRAALEAGGINTQSHPGEAYEYAKWLPNQGFREVDNNSKLLPGDISVEGKTDLSPHGHIAMWTGTQWVSDKFQNSRVVTPPGKHGTLVLLRHRSMPITEPNDNTDYGKDDYDYGVDNTTGASAFEMRDLLNNLPGNVQQLIASSPQSQQDFVNRMRTLLVNTMRTKKFIKPEDLEGYADVMVAQVANETGWGKHIPGGGRSNNWSGMTPGTAKLHGRGSTGVIHSKGTGDYNKYAIFDSIEDWADDYVEYLNRKWQAFDKGPAMYLEQLERNPNNRGQRYGGYSAEEYIKGVMGCLPRVRALSTQNGGVSPEFIRGNGGYFNSYLDNISASLYGRGPMNGTPGFDGKYGPRGQWKPVTSNPDDGRYAPNRGSQDKQVSVGPPKNFPSRGNVTLEYKILGTEQGNGGQGTYGRLFVNGKYFSDAHRTLANGAEKNVGKTVPIHWSPSGKIIGSIAAGDNWKSYRENYIREKYGDQAVRLGRMPGMEDGAGNGGNRIHAGTDSSWSEGCLVVGYNDRGKTTMNTTDSFATWWSLYQGLDTLDKNGGRARLRMTDETRRGGTPLTRTPARTPFRTPWSDAGDELRDSKITSALNTKVPKATIDADSVKVSQPHLPVFRPTDNDAESTTRTPEKKKSEGTKSAPVVIAPQTTNNGGNTTINNNTINNYNFHNDDAAKAEWV